MEVQTEDDINKLIENKIEESTTLEYKDPDALKDNSEIAKDVSAMANSEGGTIIYGIGEKEGLPSAIVWISDISLQGKIDQVIQSAIVPKVDYIIKKVESLSKKGKFALCVEVSKSEIAPHQAYRKEGVKKYYRRNGSRVREMEHYEIEDLFFKRKRPLLQISLRNVSESVDKPAYEIYLENIGKVVAEQTYIKLTIPSEFQINTFEKTKDFLGLYSSYECTLKDTLVYPTLNTLVGIMYHPKKFEFGMFKLNFLMVCKDMEVLEGEIFVDYAGKLKVNYGEVKTHPYIQQMSDYIFSKNNPFDPTTP